jgi:predicted PurR-regulated permease PerM
MDRELNLSITTSTIVKTILLLLLFWLLFYLRDLVLVVLTAVVIASAIEPAAKWFSNRRVPRLVSVLIVYLLFFGLFFTVFYFFIPPVLVETARLISALPTYVEGFNTSIGVLDQTPLLGSAGSSGAFSFAELAGEMRAFLSELSTNVFATISAIFGGVLSFVLILVLSFYFAVQEKGIDDFLRIVTPVKHQRYVIDLWRRSQYKIGRWMQGQLLLGLIVGVLVYLGLTILGVKYALVLAVIAALFELIPVFGPTLSAIPAVIVAFVDGGVTLGILVIALYVIIQQFENHLIYPLVVTKVVGVPPLLVIIGLVVGGKLAGFLGIILAAPVAAAIQEFVKDIEHRREFVLGNEKKEDT